MALCTICCDLTATISLLSCNNCQVCEHCRAELVDQIVPLRCQCDKPVSIIVADPDREANTTNPTEPIRLAMVTKALDKLTKVYHGLIDLSTKIKSLYQPSKIMATIAARLAYLPDHLVADRADILLSQLVQANQGLLKSIDLELANLAELRQICSNILASTRQPAQQAYLTYLGPRINQAAQTARNIRDGNYYDLLIYREVSPVDLNSIGSVAPVYSTLTKTGFRDQGSLAQPAITVYRAGFKQGRQQRFCDARAYDDYYDQGHLLADITFYNLDTAKPGYELNQYTVILERKYNRAAFRSRRHYCALFEGPCVKAVVIVKDTSMAGYRINPAQLI